MALLSEGQFKSAAWPSSSWESVGRCEEPCEEPGETHQTPGDSMLAV